MTFLAMDDNKLTELPTQIGLLTKLRSLYFGDNYITAVPREFTALVNIVDLTFACSFLPGTQ